MISAPVIQNSIPNGNVQITGGGLAGFSAKDADEPRHRPQVRLAAVPDHGALERADQRRRWGAQFLVQTVLAGLIGIALVFAFMLIYYRLPGGVASFALIYYTLVMVRASSGSSR